MRTSHLRGIQTIIVFFLLSFCLTVGSASAALIKRNASVMGTDLEITLTGDDEAVADNAMSAVVREMARIEDVMSEWKDSSVVSEINRSAGIKPVKVSDELFKLIDASVTVSTISGGAFDVTWAGIRGLWDFQRDNERMPTPDEIREKLPLINYKNMELNPSKKTVFLKKKGMAIGLGAIAKGYAVDRTMQVLAGLGIKNAIVKAGGDMRVQGLDGKSPWKIGIRDPRDKTRVAGFLALSNVSISTSGDYERFFIKDGVLYHHILDPRTGMPARGCRSVTILAPDTMTSDALSTAVFVMGTAAGMKLIKELPGIEGIIIDSEGKIHASGGIKLQEQ